MSFGSTQVPDPEDYFADTRMSFGDHLEELRMHLWKAIAGFAIALFLSFFVGKAVLRFIAAPVEQELQAYWDRYYKKRMGELNEEAKTSQSPITRPFRTTLLVPTQEWRKALGVKETGTRRTLNIVPSVQPILDNLELYDWMDAQATEGAGYVELPVVIQNPGKWTEQMGVYEKQLRPARLSTLNVQEAFMVYFQVCIVTAFVLGSPWIFYQVWSFIAAGLYPHEKRYVNIFLPVSLGLFLAGVLVCQFLVIPKAVEALLWFNEWLELEPDFRLNEWLGFAIFMPVVFGLSFQTPLVMLFLERIGILTVDTFRSARRIAWFLMAIFAAVITPSTDAFSMLFLWVPMSLLYELGILMCLWAPKRPTFDFEESESEELIEV
jgi:sec-independent protein translocase protein TatC